MNKKIVQRKFDVNTAESLQKSGINPVLARIFAARGVSDITETSFDFSNLIPPDKLFGANNAAVFLADAILENKKILIVADYDCDGATACAVAVRGLKILGAKWVDYIVPNRFDYGYGLTPELVKEAYKYFSPEIIITVDNGIASIDGVNEANNLGIDVLITDHHLPANELPNAKVIVNPNQPNCSFPSKNAAGVTVMFYVLLALRAELRKRNVFEANNQPRLDGLLDLVALGTVADLVQLDNNNRILVAQGLQRIRNGNMHAGLAALFDVSRRSAQSATTDDLSFAIAPRLNAAGRMSDMKVGIECMLTDDKERAAQLANELNAINAERREIEVGMQTDALSQLADHDFQNKSTITLFAEDWHQGIVGLIASRIKDRFYRPTIAFAPSGDGFLHGSGRSISGFHLRDALDLVSKYAPSLVKKFGGHAMAAGITIPVGAFDAFTKAFEEVGRSSIGKEQLEQTIETDGSLEKEYFSFDFIEQLNSQIWGQGFPQPIFCDEFRICNVRLLKEKHLRLIVEKNGEIYEAIWFGHINTPPDYVRIAYRLNINEFNLNKRIQLIIQHMEAVK